MDEKGLEEIVVYKILKLKGDFNAKSNVR